jgi:hypothetical protein
MITKWGIIEGKNWGKLFYFILFYFLGEGARSMSKQLIQ